MIFSPPLSAQNDQRATDSPFAVLEFLNWDHDWNSHHYSAPEIERSIKLMKEAGIGMVRMDILWGDVEPVQGRWEYERYDRILNGLDKHGVKVLALLDYNAAWSDSNWNTPPDPEAFLTYVRSTVRRYKGRIRDWEIWNEPDQITYWDPQDEMQTYAQLLKKVYAAIKEEDPSARVVLGGLSGDLVTPLSQVYRQGGGAFFDIAAVHPFVDPLTEESASELARKMEAVRAVMRENGDADKPLWVTEIGCPGVKRFSKAQPWWLGKNPSEDQQSEWVVSAYRTLLKQKGVEKVFWAFFRDTRDHFLSGTDHFGLIREDFSRKPAFSRYKKMVREWIRDRDRFLKGSS